jgi:hypothetical protein
MSISSILKRLRRSRAERIRQEQAAEHATVYVARDGRGRVIAAH